MIEQGKEQERNPVVHDGIMEKREGKGRSPP